MATKNINEEIKKLQKEAKTLEREGDKIQSKCFKLWDKINELQREKQRANIEKKFHVGDVFFKYNGITNYHCNVAEIVEVIEITQGRYYPLVTVREYRIHYSDGDYSTGIEKYQLSDYKVGRKITKKEFAELKEIMLNPDTFESSKWYVKE